MKLRCKYPMDNLEPKMLRDMVKRHAEIEDRDARKNDFLLYRLVQKLAVRQHETHLLIQEQKVKAPGITKATTGNGNMATKLDNNKQGKSQQPARGASTRGGNANPNFGGYEKSEAANGSKKSQPPATGCWHCKGQHWLRDCPTASEADKETAAAQMRELRSKNNKAKKISATVAAGEVLIGGLVTMSYCADSGSDCTYVPRQCLDEIIALGGKPTVLKLPQSQQVEVAGGSSVTCTDGVTLDLKLQTAAGPVHLSEVHCLVMDADEQEFILGNDMLVSLGINVDEQLSQLASGPTPVDVDPFEEEEVAEPQSSAEMTALLLEMVAQAAENGFDATYLDQLRATVLEYADVFRVELEADPPADIEPLKITLKEGSEPFRTKPRRYAPAQSQFLREHTKKLERMGFIKRNNQSHWACAAVPVPKANRPGEFRLTIDYRPVNAKTAPIVGTAPDLAAAAQHVAGAYGYAAFDLPEGFSQMELHEDSQKQMSFVTDDAVFTPTRVPQGATDSALHLQNQMQLVFSDMLYHEILIWIDDLLLHARSPAAFIETLRRFFDRVRMNRLKLSAKKSCLFKKHIKWCGRVISDDGMQHDTTRISALQGLPLPTTAADL